MKRYLLSSAITGMILFSSMSSFATERVTVDKCGPRMTNYTP
jgi:hypothetical protein